MKRKSEVIAITPIEAAAEKLNNIPDVVIEVVNRLLAEKVSGGYATILQKDILDRLVTSGLDKKEIFKNGWLDFEPIFRESGWEVSYDGPGYNETFEASFKFSINKKTK